MYKKICVIILFLLCLQNCGYSPMITKIENKNFNITNLDLEGDQKINNFIKRELNKYVGNNEANKNFEINIVTNYKKVSLVKDAKGNTTDFKLEANLILSFIEKKENQEKIVNLIENFTIKKNDNNYDQNDYERAIINNMAQALVNKIIFHLTKN